MLVGVLMLLFIGFNRIWHFVYIGLDAMLCGFFNLTRLPVASTFWRCVNSLGINQAKYLLIVMSILHERVWQLCKFEFYQIRINIDTTVKTVYATNRVLAKVIIPRIVVKKVPDSYYVLSKNPVNIFWASFARVLLLPVKRLRCSLRIPNSIFSAVSNMSSSEPMVNFYHGKPLKPHSKPV
jgi:hypothetical protein